MAGQEGVSGDKPMVVSAAGRKALEMVDDAVRTERARCVRILQEGRSGQPYEIDSALCRLIARIEAGT